MADLEYLYAVVDRLPRRWRAPGRGVAGTTVRARRIEDVVAVSSRMIALPPRTLAALGQHEDVVQALIDAEAVVPLGFGTAVADVDAWVRARLGLLHEALDRLRGSVEMRVRLLGLDPGLPDGVLAEVAERVVQSTGLPPARCRARRRALDTELAFLVPRNQVDAFLTRLAPVAARAAGVAVVPAGPAPPYHFAPALGLPERAAPEYPLRHAWSLACLGSLSTRSSA
jgi:hypothetical protein